MRTNKKTALIVLSSIMACSGMIALSSCKKAHTHSFEEAALPEFIAKEATCVDAPSYFKSCKCGEKSEETFIYGEPLGHDYEYHKEKEATCTENGWKSYKTCSRCDYTNYEETKATGHTFNAKATDSKYLKSEATCTSKAVYYYSCACGEKGTETFEYGELLAHTYNKQVTTSTYLKSEATCASKAVYYYSCSCGEKGTETFEYGEFDSSNHLYDQEIKSEETFKSEATCQHGTTYYKSCSCGDIGEETFEDTDFADHSFSNFAINGSTSCVECGSQMSEVATSTIDVSVNGDGSINAYVISLANGKYAAYIVGAGTMKSYLDKNYPLKSYAANLVKLEIDSRITTIGSCAFYNSTALTEITIPSNVTNIKNSAFSGMTNLTTINYNATNCADLAAKNYVFSYAGENGDGITLNIGANVTKIPSYLFYPNSANASYMAKIKTLSFAPGSVCTSIGDYAFCDSYYILGIDLPDSVTTIGQYSFSGLTRAKELTIGSGVTTIGNNAFYNLVSLEEINYNATIASDLASMNYVFHNAGANSEGIALKVGANVTRIPSKLFYPSQDYVPNIVDVSFEEGSVCTSIGRDAFSRCSGITSLALPDSLVTIDQFSFYYCTGITNLVIPDSVTTIGQYAFCGCTGIRSLTLGSGLTSIGTLAFKDLTNLSELNYNAADCADFAMNNQIFYDNGLQNMDGVTLRIGESVTRIQKYLFCATPAPYNNTPNFSKVIIGSNVAIIDSWAFSHCDSIQGVYYNGTEEEWNAIDIKDNNTPLTSAARYYYSETNPFEGEDALTSGNFWHYEDGEIAIWEIEIEIEEEIEE